MNCSQNLSKKLQGNLSQEDAELIPGLDSISAKLYNEYKKLYSADPFAESTITTWEHLPIREPLT